MKVLKAISLAAIAAISGCGFPHNSAERPPAPYTPLKVEVSGETMSVSVWNRTYRYKNSVFPVSVETAGREIFAAPMSLHAKFGDKEGEFHDWQYTLLRADARSAQVLVAAHCENVMVNAALTFAYDGFVKTDLKVVPYGYHSLHVWVRDYDPTLAELWFDVDLKKESSTLLHFWPSADSAQTWAPEIRNSAETRPQDLPFKPYVWCGWEDGGFGISCESNEAFELADARKCISVAQEGGRTRLRYRLLDHMPKAWKGRRDRWEDALLPVCWSFGLQATPVKPRPAGDPDVYRRLHIYEVDKANILTSDIAERFGKAGVRYVVLHSTFSRAEGYGIIGDPKEFQAIVDRFHENGVKVLVYYGYEYPTIMPDWNEKWRDYLIRSPSGGAEGGWQAETHRAYQSCYNSGWARDVEENVYDIVDRYGLDGIYTDGMYIPWECANERHGCGWRDADGKLHVTYPIAAVRDLAERLYEGLHARGGTIDVHQSACMVSPVLSFADSCFDGEHVQQSLADNLESVSTESFRCEYSGYAFGIPMSFIAYTNEKLKIGMLAAMTLVHNVHPVPRELGDLDYVANIWKIYEELDLDERTFEPYWSNGIKTPKGVYASAYRDGGKVTYVVSNLTLKRKRVSLPACGRAAAKDLVTGKSYPAAGGAIELELEPFTPYLLDCTGAGRSSEPVASAAPLGAEFENGFVRLAFDEKGRVASIREKKSGRELIDERHAFVTVATRDGRVLEPVSLERRGDGTLSFGFPGGGSCELAFSPFDGGWTIETRSFSVPDAEFLKFARENISKNLLKGFLLAAWVGGVLPQNEAKHLHAIDVMAEAMKIS